MLIVFIKYNPLYEVKLNGETIGYVKNKQAMEELINWLQNNGVHNIKLKPSAAGRHLYDKFGFCDSGEMELWI